MTRQQVVWASTCTIEWGASRRTGQFEEQSYLVGRIIHEFMLDAGFSLGTGADEFWNPRGHR